MKATLPLACLLVLAACAESAPPDPEPVPGEGGYNMVDPVPDPAPLLPPQDQAGGWTRGTAEGRPAMLFGPQGADAQLVLFCDARDGLAIERRGIVQTGPIEMMELRVADQVGRYAVRPIQPGSTVLRAVIPPMDPMIEQLAAGEGTMRVAAGEGEALTAPLDGAVAELVRTCATSRDGG